MAEKPAQDRTEEATPKHLQEAREKGDVAKSAEVNSAMLLMSVILFFYYTGAEFLQGLVIILRGTYSSLETTDITATNLPELAIWFASSMTSLLGPFLIVILSVALLANYLQVGVIFAPKALRVKWERVNPGAGLKRIFSTKGLVELIKGLLKMGVIGMIIYSYLAGRVKEYPYLTYMTPYQIIGTLGHDIFMVGMLVCIAYIALAIADFAYQKWEYKRKMRMSKQEIREEHKQMEGSPEIKARIRAVQRAMSRNRMMAEIPKASVVITNPTQYAVALKYDDGDDSKAPMVVAKGQRKVAEKIIKIARENDIPIKESPPLARALFKTAVVGEEIPYEYYRAVAEILAEIFWAKYGKAS